jgi:DNA-binding NtrC family response regulator
MIHHRSSRRDQPFVVVDCGAIPAELIEAKLFGLWEHADGGTVFFEEITETTTSFQAKLLSALQSGEISRVGSNESQQVDVRVIAASHRNVEEEVAAGKFSYDLFCRLNQASIVLPPLREPRVATSPGPSPANDDWVTLSVIEGRYVERVLEHTGGNKQAAARILAVDRKTLDRMIKRHHIDSNHVKAVRAKASSRN